MHGRSSSNRGCACSTDCGGAGSTAHPGKVYQEWNSERMCALIIAKFESLVLSSVADGSTTNRAWCVEVP